MEKRKGILIAFLAALMLSAGFMLISADDEMTVEAEFINYGNQFISIEVPDYISLGEVSKDDPFSDEKNISISNTGTINAIVTPELASGSHAVFNYTYFREHKTQNGTAFPFEHIEDFSINVEGGDHKTFYMSMNLTGFNGTLSSNNINLSTTIRFTAMPSS